MYTRNISMFYVILVVVSWAALAVVGQLYPPPRIYSLHIRSDIQFRFATTLVTSRVANPANYSQETVFEFILPEEAFISNFTLEIDGEIYPGIVKDKDEAKKEYEKAKKRGKTTGLVSQKPRETRKFKVQVSVAAFSKSTFNLTYQEVLKRVKGSYEHRIFVTPGYPVDDIQITVAIQESRDITKLLVPPVKELNALLTAEEDLMDNEFAVITRPSKRSAIINYALVKSDQGSDGLSGKFVVQYDIERSLDGGDLLVVNGYFVHFLAPDVKKAIPKDVLFILDVSGSMSGRKIEQLKDAMYSVLDELQEGDRFNIITFSDGVTSYQPDMIDVTRDEIVKAKSYMKSTYASGWTDINSAILEGIDTLKQSKQEDERSPVIVFLTDGLPSTGVQDELKILQNIHKANEGGIPVFSLAFGKDASWDLVKKMAIQNDGVAKKIYEDSDADLQISGFYDELAVTLLNNVSVKYLDDAVDAESLTKSEFKNYFKGSEMIVAGKLSDPGAPTVDLEILGNSVDGSLVLTVDKGSNFIDVSDVDSLMGLTDFQKITEKTWAYLTIKQLLNTAAGEVNQTVIDVMKNRAKELSLQYGFVTPLTSMVVTKPEVDPDEWRPPTPTTTPKPTTTRRPYRRRGGGGGGYGGGGGGDPHYMIRIRNIEHPICFDVQSKEGEIHNLISDPRNKITINTQIISGEMNRNGEPKTFIGEISIQMSHHVIVITPEAIIYDTKVFMWTEERIKHFGGHEFMLSDTGHLLTVRFKFGAEVLIRRHSRKEGVSYLNVFVKHEDGFSKKTTGLIGQFVNGFKHIYLRKQYKNKNGTTMAKLQIKEGARFPTVSNDVTGDTGEPVRQRIPAKLVARGEVVEHGTEMCWMVHKQFEEALLGVPSAYLLNNLIDM